MFLPLGMGVASASTGFSTVQAGGPPSAPAPVRHYSKPRYVPREKPLLRNPRWRPPRIDVSIENDNESHNAHKRRVERRREEIKPIVKPEPVKEEKEQEPEPEKHDDGRWWW
ncbi:hypothetical protein [Nonomuraea sp. NPDC050643]|uniref:hypothetical protein n=1 Tax=Nonomuraea sp. NPDC050643 TaxID=3155660 RepID=UPI0033F6F70F